MARSARSSNKGVSRNVANRYVSTVVRPISRSVSRSSFAFNNFSVRPRIRSVVPNLQRRAVVAPNRLRRKENVRVLKTVLPEVYKQVHNCKKEWSRLLSWRSSRSTGGNKVRSRMEREKSKSNFYRRDC